MRKTEYFQATNISTIIVNRLVSDEYVLQENMVSKALRSFCIAANCLYDNGYTSITIVDDKDLPIVRIHKMGSNPIGFFLTESSNVISELPRLNGKDLVLSMKEDMNSLAEFRDIIGKKCGIKFINIEMMIFIYRLIFTEICKWIKENPETDLDLFCTFIIEPDQYCDEEYIDLEKHMNTYLKFASELKM